MKPGMTIILLSLLAISGCANFTHMQQTYYVKESAAQAKNRPEPRLMAQIVPSTESAEIPFIFHNRKWGGPYSIRLHSGSRPTDCTYYLLHSLVVQLEGHPVDEQTYAPPVKIDLCEDTNGENNNDTLFRHELGNSLIFEEGSKVELEVIYSQANISGKRTILMQGTGEMKQSRSSLWSAYMGI